MLAVTEEATSAIDGMLSSPETPDEAGIRITTATTEADDGAPRAELRLALVERPEETDTVVEDAPVFLEPQAAALLDDKVLHAEVDGDQIQFQIRDQLAT